MPIFYLLVGESSIRARHRGQRKVRVRPLFQLTWSLRLADASVRAGTRTAGDAADLVIMRCAVRRIAMLRTRGPKGVQGAGHRPLSHAEKALDSALPPVTPQRQATFVSLAQEDDSVRCEWTRSRTAHFSWLCGHRVSSRLGGDAFRDSSRGPQRGGSAQTRTQARTP